MDKGLLLEETEVAQKMPPTIFIELVDQGSSGFIQDDTMGTANPIELKSPSIHFIPNEGYRRGVKTDIVNGKEVQTRFNEKIRYIKNESVISVMEQRRLGIEPSSLPREDKIPIEKGYATIVREGTSVGLYDYMTQVYYNESNPERSEKASARFRVIHIDQQAEKFNEDELIAADAVKFVGTLYQRTGKNQYTYNENKIDAVCEMLSVFASTQPTKIKALLMLAKQRPEWFLTRVTKLEQTTVTEVLHALELNIIKFDANTAQYSNKDTIIKAFGGSKPLTRDQLVSMLADYLRTQDGHTAYMELKAEIETALNNLLN